MLVYSFKAKILNFCCCCYLGTDLFKSPGCDNTIAFWSEGSSPSGPLYALRVRDKITIGISNRGNSGWRNCEVNSSSSWNLGCNGSRLWSSQHIDIMKKLFKLTDRGIVSGFFGMEVRNNNSPIKQRSTTELGTEPKSNKANS